MNSDNDSNIIYGGDHTQKTDYCSLGELFFENFSAGGDKIALVLIDFG